ncbi:hypothetical protein RRG08_033855 [Elysia crispata]|uniref:Uncharacterized protein n=1 Tax=Elysia crispata TaxID=231223 RepID=A0AAE1B8I4_9GAST|nr:hypothetical protein RRG08_033855 [Elysia crispata]
MASTLRRNEGPFKFRQTDRRPGLLDETLVKSRSVPREQNHRLLLQDTPAVGKIRDESHFLTLSNPNPLLTSRTERSVPRRYFPPRRHGNVHQDGLTRHRIRHQQRRGRERLLLVLSFNNDRRLRPLTSRSWGIHEWPASSQNQQRTRQPLQTLNRNYGRSERTQ